MNVIEALAKVAAELPGIGKGEKSPQGYSFRGIEAITKEAGPLLAKHGVVIVPQVQSIEIRDILVNSKPWTDTILTVRYRIYGPGEDGGEGHRFIEATTVGIGRDNSDKGANKAMSQAFKYALIQTLCIADSKDDGDFETHEAEPEPTIDALDAEILVGRLTTLGKAIKGYPAAWIAAKLPTIGNIGTLEVSRLEEAKTILTAAEESLEPFTQETQETLTP